MDSYVHFYFFFLIILFPFSSLAQTNGTIPVGTTLTATTENSTPWLSPSGDFAFGFQFLQQNGLFLLSIWYHNLPQKTIVWYANEGNLVPNGSKIELNAQIGLVLTDPQGIQLWISRPISSKIDHGFINDTGNFVLLGRDSSSLWESFGDPTDTLLPTQTMEINGVLNARKSETNFSQGRFQFRLRENGNAVLNPRDLGSDVAYEPYYSGNTNDISNLSNSGRQLVMDETGQIFVVRRNGERVDLTGQTVTSSADYYYRATLNFDGVFAVYSHPKRPDGDQNWTSIWSKPDNICLNLTEDKGSGACGHNSVCELNNYRRPVCKCPTGHVLMDPNDEYGSCKPTFVQSCDENGTNLVTFDEMSNVDWPFNDYEHRNQSSAEGCKNSCLNDCFCAVAIYIRDSCWKKRLPLSNGRRDASVNHLAFLKIRKGDFPPKDGSRNKKQLHMVIPDFPVYIALVPVVISGFVLCFLCLRIRKLKRTETNGEDRDLLLLNLDNSSKANTHIINKSREDKKVIELPMFSFSSISAATNKFSAANKLGEGGFGPVYKGSLVNGQSVAVKRLSKMSGQGLEELRNEAILIAKLQHRNLVRLLGYCIEKDENILIYEYMPNKSLDSFLFDPNKQKLLNWSRRVQIIEGIAQGILYLHEYSRLRIIHRDLKASNILLDGDMNPKISDFGMARIFGGNQLQANTNRIVGTYGYMSPEYAMEGRFSVKSDVFAFGVLLLEILSGKKNTGFHHLDCLSLLGYAWELWENERALELIDPILQIPSSSSMPLRYILVGLLCVQDSLEDRPTISDVLAMLSNEHTTLASPKRPAFTSGRTLLFASSDRGKAKNCSINDLTTSIFEAR